MGAVFILAGGFSHFTINCLVCPLSLHLVEWEREYLILMETILFGRKSFDGRLTPPGNTSDIAGDLGTEIHMFLYFQAVHSQNYAILLGSKGL